MVLSPLFTGSEGLVTPAGLVLPFSGAVVAAHNTSEPKKNETEMMRQSRKDLLNLDVIVPPKLKKDSTLLKRGLFRQHVKNIQIFGILSEGKM